MERPFPAYEGDEPYIFVSYSHTDAAVVYPEITALKARGFNIWYDEGIPPGSNWRDELAEALARCFVFLFYLTPRSAASENCNKEVSYALAKNRPMLCVSLEETTLPAGLEFSLNDIQTLNRSFYDESSYKKKIDTSIATLLPEIKEAIGGHEVISNTEHARSHTSYLVKQKGLDRKVQLTLIHNRSDTSHTTTLLKQEAMVFLEMDNSNFSTLITDGLHDGNPFYIFESVNNHVDSMIDKVGERNYIFSWHEFSYKEMVRDDHLPFELVFKIVDGIVAILQDLDRYGHHLGAFSPANFAIDKNHQLRLVYPSIFSQTSASETSDYYASPEQEHGIIDIRSNFYSLGILLYELLTNNLPFKAGKSVEDFLEELPDTLIRSLRHTYNNKLDPTAFQPLTLTHEQKHEMREQFNSVQGVLRRLLAVEPKDRYRSPRELSLAVEKLLSENSWQARRYLDRLFSDVSITQRRSIEEENSLHEKKISIETVDVQQQLGVYQSQAGDEIGFETVDGEIWQSSNAQLFSALEPVVLLSENEWLLARFTINYLFVRRHDGTVARIDATIGSKKVTYWKITEET